MDRKVHLSLYILLVYILTLGLRLLLAWQTHDSPLHTLDGQFLSILTYDAALYGYYGSLLLEGLPHTKDVHLIEYIIYYLVTLTPFTLDQVMYYTPAFLSALIVIPTMLIASLYIHSKTIIILVGLVSGIGYGFYSRSYLGYFDTDVLNIFFPMIILFGMLSFVKNSNLFYIAIMLTFTFLYILWYQSSKPLIIIMYGLFLLYNTFNYLNRYKKFVRQYKYYFFLAFAIVSVLLFYFLDLHIFMRHITRYLTENNLLQISNFNFVAPMQHISEAKSTNIYFMAHLIAGNIYIFLLALVGYLLLIYKHKEMILSLPMVGLGLLSLIAGVRFHIYTIFIFIISYYFLFHFLFNYFNFKKKIFLALIMLITIPTFYESYHILKEWNTKATPIFSPEQVTALKQLKEIKNLNDYAVSWWDYGYGIQYYTGLKTMIDNGRHRADNYTVANILLSDSQKFSHHAIHYFYNLFDKYQRNAIVHALSKHKQALRLFQEIENNDTYLKQKNNKYLILPSQIAELAYTIYMYANIDPLTGKKTSNHIFKMFTALGQDSNFIQLSDNARIEKKTSTLHTHNKKLTIKTIAHIEFKKGKKNIHRSRLSTKGLNLIIKDNKYYVMDDYFYNSTMIQMVFFDHYNKKYFEPMYQGNSISIYKLK